MPRDLTSFVKEDALSDMSPLGRSEQHQDQQPTQQDPPGSQDEPPMMFRDSIQAKGNQERDELHPYTQTLTLSDVDSCVILEEAAFPPHERATKEKVSQPISYLVSGYQPILQNSATSPF